MILQIGRSIEDFGTRIQTDSKVEVSDEGEIEFRSKMGDQLIVQITSDGFELTYKTRGVHMNPNGKNEQTFELTRGEVKRVERV